MEKKMENEMETGITMGYIIYIGGVARLHIWAAFVLQQDIVFSDLHLQGYKALGSQICWSVISSGKATTRI